MRALALLVAAAACPRAAALVVYYNVFSKSVATAVEIVYEQLTELRASPIWDEVEEIRYSTIGKGKMRNHVARICREVNAMRPQGASKKPCVRLGAKVPADVRRARARAEALTKRSGGNGGE